MTDEPTPDPTPDLSETLDRIAEQAKPVDLSQAVARKVRSLRRRRTASGGAAVLLVVAIVGGGGWALTRTTGATSIGGSAGGAAASSDFGWFAYTPLPGGTPLVRTVPGVEVHPTPPSSPAVPTTEPISTVGPVTTTGNPATPCTVFDDFAAGAAPAGLVVTATMKAKARAMGTELCRLVGGGARYTIEEWISTGGLSTGYSGLTYDVQAHLTGAGAGPVNNEAWVAVYQAPAGTKATFADGTTIALETRLANTLKNKIEVEGGPFDAFATR